MAARFSGVFRGSNGGAPSFPTWKWVLSPSPQHANCSIPALCYCNAFTSKTNLTPSVCWLLLASESGELSSGYSEAVIERVWDKGHQQVGASTWWNMMGIWGSASRGKGLLTQGCKHGDLSSANRTHKTMNKVAQICNPSTLTETGEFLETHEPNSCCVQW